MTRADVERAIEICTHSRKTHVEWRNYLVQWGHDAEVQQQAEIAGDLEHQTSRIERYDHVLSVLRQALELTDARTQGGGEQL